MIDGTEARIVRVQRAYRMASLNYMPEQNLYYSIRDAGMAAGSIPGPKSFLIGKTPEFDGKIYKMEALPALEAVADKVEESLRKPGYRVLRTPAVQDVVTVFNNMGMRAALKSIASGVFAKASPMEWIEGMRMMASWDDGCKGFLWAATPSTLFIFRGVSEEELMNKFKAVKTKKTVPTPEKVVSKMMFGRLRKLQAAMELYNRTVKEIQVTAEKETKEGRPPTSPVPELLQWSEPSTVEAWGTLAAHLKATWKYHVNYNRDIRDIPQEIDKIIKEKGIQDSHMQEACESLLVAEVMDA